MSVWRILSSTGTTHAGRTPGATLRRVALIVARMTGKRVGDTATRMFELRSPSCGRSDHRPKMLSLRSRLVQFSFHLHYKAQSLPHVRQVRLVSLVKDRLDEILWITLRRLARYLQQAVKAGRASVSPRKDFQIGGRDCARSLGPLQARLPAKLRQQRRSRREMARSGAPPGRRACLLRAQFGKGEPAAPASPSRGPGNGILRAETGGLFQAQNAGEQSEFGSQTTLRLTNPPELRGFLSTRKPPRFVGTAWSGMQGSN